MRIDHSQETYKTEALDYLEKLEAALIELEEKPQDQELIDHIFRILHTIKGSGAMFGFDRIAAFTHDIETVYALVRKGDIPVSRQLLELTLAAGDQIKAMLLGASNSAATERLKQSFYQLAPAAMAAGCPIQAENAIPSQADFNTWRIRFRPHQDLFVNGANPATVLDELRTLGECDIVNRTGRIPLLREMQPETCYLFWDIVLTARVNEAAIRNVFIFVAHQSDLGIELVQPANVAAGRIAPQRIGEILVDRGDLSPSDVHQAYRRQKRLGEILIETGKADEGVILSALAEQEHVKRQTQKHLAAVKESGLRVDAAKLDALINLVGEMITVQAQLDRRAAMLKDRRLCKLVKNMERLTGAMRENAINLRMLPIGSGFIRFKRLVRDLALELNKKVRLITTGDETELDKAVLDRLLEPMVHLIRNSIDHGIEAPAQRVAAGKPECGVVQISAEYRDAGVMIGITDDGKGLDLEGIRQKALAAGLIQAEAVLSREEIMNLIFAPGLSTAHAVTAISGRGVGLNVVKRTIEGLRGNIRLSSQPGQGTTFTLKLPLTLAIIDGLLVKIDQNSFVIPLLAVEKCVDFRREKRIQTDINGMVNVRGELVPYIILRDVFRFSGAAPKSEQIVIAGINGQRAGFVVDEVIGNYQTVLKPLGKTYHQVEGFSGATILDNGEVGLVLDLHKLINGKQNH